MSTITKFSIATVALLLFAGTAQAHPKLVSSTPAANATMAKSNRVVLTFNEKLVAKFSGAEIVMTGMPGMKGHSPMQVSGVTSQVGPDGKTLIVTSKAPFGAGTYKLSWHVVAADTHRIEGSFNFAVK